MNDSNFLNTMLTIEYLVVNGREPSGGFGSNSDLFPFGWHSEFSENVQCDILREACEKKCSIAETDMYKKYSEHLDDLTIK